MCGITGFWSSDLGSADSARDTLVAMTGALAHRGPDDEGVWLDVDSGVGLGHRRLSIVDLSAEGHQPMTSASGRFVISYNGEIYNFGALRRELEAAGLAPRFRGHSDTEVMLAAIEAWGLDRALERFIGMFAFALWDRRDRKLQLVRDRLGIKPLYYAFTRTGIAFGSELRAILQYAGVSDAIDLEALASLLRYGCVPAPLAIYRSTRKLRPGSIVTLTDSRAEGLSERLFWRAADVIADSRADPFAGDESQATDALDTLLRDAIRLRMVADVPLGAFLSGGIDSSTVVALMQAQSTRRVRTFSIGVPEAAYDEAPAARAVAAHLGTDHTELYITSKEVLELIPQLPRLYDEPFADSSQAPTFLVCRLARSHVTVALSGDGGDELFAGYNRHVWLPKLSPLLRLPKALRDGASRGLLSFSPATWDRTVAGAESMIPRALRARLPGEKLHKVGALLQANDVDGAYEVLRSVWSEAPLERRQGPQPSQETPALRNSAERAMYRDLVGYLPDDILTKVDRASMAVGLEARVPLLDHRVVSFAWRLPLEFKLRGFRGKRVLRRVLHRYVPRELVERPKMGFGIPIGSWLRGPLRDWAEALLDARELRADGLLDAPRIRARWQEHLTGARDWHGQLWVVLMYQAWRSASRTWRRATESAAVELQT